MKPDRPLIAITVGDPAGIGPEITAKALSQPKIYESCRPLVIADTALMTQAVEIVKAKLEVNTVNSPQKGVYKAGILDVLDLENVERETLEYGRVRPEYGHASFQYIVKGIELALSGEVEAVVTGPISKEAVNLAGHHYAGHTEIFAHLTKTRDVCMMLVDKNMRISHVTTHVALSRVSEYITQKRVLEVIKLTHDALVQMGIEFPRIAIAGLNPHNGEDGLFGQEEIEQISPAVEAACQLGFDATGPVSPDTVFVKLKGGQYDAVVAMYHDQGHIAAKLASFNYDAEQKALNSVAGVNVTLGLPIVRTSVEHGVAFDQAGKGTASPDSMLDAIALATLMVRKR